jgi:hypothetical protein
MAWKAQLTMRVLDTGILSNGWSPHKIWSFGFIAFPGKSQNERLTPDLAVG